MLLEPSEYKIVKATNPVVNKLVDDFHPDKQFKFVCKECESIIYVKHYDDIIDMGKTCNHCRRKQTIALRNATMENNKIKGEQHAKCRGN